MKTFLGALARKSVPFCLRVRCHQIRRHAEWRLHPQLWAEARGSIDDFPVVIDARSSPLRRRIPDAPSAVSDGKETNIALGADAVDRLVVAPGEVFSFCRTVGPPTRRRGFVPGLEMHDQKFAFAEGGGLCQLANLLFGLAVHAGAQILERHRHSFDLFPDTDRTVPFGFGATVFYNHVDFQFRNSLDQRLLLHTWVDGEWLRGEARLERCPGWRVRVVEKGHRFFRENGEVWRENHLFRQKIGTEGTEHPPVSLIANRAKVLYPAEHLIDP